MKRLVILLGMGVVSTLLTIVPMSSAQAAVNHPSARATHHHAAHVTRHVSRAPAARHSKPPLSSIQPYYLASSWCGNWWRGPMYCVNFSRSEQKWLTTVSVTTAAAAICTASLGIGCVVASTVAAVAIRYVEGHGICPLSKPVLEVEYAPYPGGYAACSNG
jgi:hypothetical protein